MKRRILIGLFAVLVIAAIGFFGIAPVVVEAGMNRVVATPLPRVSPATRALHGRLQIADMHADTLLWRRSLLDRADRGQVDLPRLEAGNVALQDQREVIGGVTRARQGVDTHFPQRQRRQRGQQQRQHRGAGNQQGRVPQKGANGALKGHARNCEKIETAVLIVYRTPPCGAIPRKAFVALAIVCVSYRRGRRGMTILLGPASC